MTHALRLLKLAYGVWACSVLQHRAGLSAGDFLGYCTARSSIRCPSNCWRASTKEEDG